MRQNGGRTGRVGGVPLRDHPRERATNAKNANGRFAEALIEPAVDEGIVAGENVCVCVCVFQKQKYKS